ncbi:phage tail protein [Pseudomonas sp. CFBP 5750]
MMLALGMFVFSLSTAAYQALQRQTEWRHSSNPRVGAAPARQFVGRGDDTITLPGIILPELSGSALSLDALRLMANTGKAWPMVEGSGRIYGLWIIESLNETKTLFFRDGTPRRIEFTLSLKRIDDDRIDLLGAATRVGVSIMRALL